VCGGRISRRSGRRVCLLRARIVAQLKITLVRSGIGRPRKHKEVLIGLGLTKMHKTVIHTDRPEMRGMIRKVRHLVQVEEIAEDGRS
jgi:large subunit ribosomal protein L30